MATRFRPIRYILSINPIVNVIHIIDTFSKEFLEATTHCNSEALLELCSLIRDSPIQPTSTKYLCETMVLLLNNYIN